jgi:hypothetical protein
VAEQRLAEPDVHHDGGGGTSQPAPGDQLKASTARRRARTPPG